MQYPQELITSRQNPLIKLAASLTERKFREREGLFRFDGKKLLQEALDADLPLFAALWRQSSVETICVAMGERELPETCRSVVLPDELFDRISEEKSPEGVICLSKHLDKWHKIATIDKRCVCLTEPPVGHTLLLESVRDPGNLGTIIRSAAAFGVGLVVLSSDCADLYHPRTLRAAMGTLFHTRVLVTEDLVGVIEELKQYGHVYAAALDATATRLGGASFDPLDAVVVGNEGHGLTPETIKACGHTVYIPMADGVESLNAGIAASVLLWELYRGNRG